MRIPLAAALIAAIAGLPAQAAVTGFLTNVSGNSTDWTNYVTGLGLSIDSGVDFTTVPLGTLAAGFYQPTHGVTLDVVNGSVIDYASPPSGSFTCPCSTGEGAVPFSRLLVMSDSSSFTASFDSPVYGFGFFYGDKYNPFGSDPTTIEVFTGANGTGASLGSFALGTNSFQLGYQVFMGVASTTAEIGSVVITDNYSGTGDGTYIDNLRIARAAEAVPEPASLGLLATGMLGAAAMRRRRRA